MTIPWQHTDCQYPQEAARSIRVTRNLARVTVTGSDEFICNIGQQLAWLAAVCQQKEEGPTYAYVGFERQTEKCHDPINNPTVPTFKIWVNVETPPRWANQSCWNDLVGPAVLIAGFPLPERCKSQHGLEISLPVMCALARIPQAVTFRGKYVFKGTYHALIPTAVYTDSIQWHFIETYPRKLTWADLDDGISMETPEFQNDADFWKSRAFLGWCPKVRDYFGKSNPLIWVQVTLCMAD